MQHSLKAILLSILTVSMILQGSFSIPCKDDPGYTFGFTGNGSERRTCKWLSRLKLVEPVAAFRLCGMQWRHNIINKKCPETCDTCPNTGLDPDSCSDKVMTHDRK